MKTVEERLAHYRENLDAVVQPEGAAAVRTANRRPIALVTSLLVLTYALPKNLNYKHPRTFIVVAAMLVIVLGRYGDQFFYFQF